MLHETIRYSYNRHPRLGQLVRQLVFRHRPPSTRQTQGLMDESERESERVQAWSLVTSLLNVCPNLSGFTWELCFGINSDIWQVSPFYSTHDPLHVYLRKLTGISSESLVSPFLEIPRPRSPTTGSFSKYHHSGVPSHYPPARALWISQSDL